jgi:hypothetical protein
MLCETKQISNVKKPNVKCFHSSVKPRPKMKKMMMTIIMVWSFNGRRRRERKDTNG